MLDTSLAGFGPLALAIAALAGARFVLGTGHSFAILAEPARVARALSSMCGLPPVHARAPSKTEHEATHETAHDVHGLVEANAHTPLAAPRCETARLQLTSCGVLGPSQAFNPRH